MPISDQHSVDEQHMQHALSEARKAFEQQEVPVGAVVIHDGKIIGRGRNSREGLNDPTAHAELLALTAAANTLGDWRLSSSVLYVTKEPCAMCAGALVNARVVRVVFGAWDEQAGCCGSLYQLCRDPRFNHQVEVQGGVLEAQCQQLLKEFFARSRAARKRGP